MLADIVSKNGNLMLSVPLRRDGQPDADEIKIVSEIGAWLKINGEAIYATRPWKIYGEGPSTVASGKGQFEGQMTWGETVHAERHPLHTVERWQNSLRYCFGNSEGWESHHQIARYEFGILAWQNRQRAAGRQRWLAGDKKLQFTRNESGLHVSLQKKFGGKTALALKIKS